MSKGCAVDLCHTHKSRRVYTPTWVEIALKSAENFRLLRRHGITIRKTVDCLIATFVLERGFALLYSDRDFDPFALHFGLDAVR